MAEKKRFTNPERVANGTRNVFVYQDTRGNPTFSGLISEWDVEVILTRKTPPIEPGFYKDDTYLFKVVSRQGVMQYSAVSLSPRETYVDGSYFPLSEVEDTSDWKPVTFEVQS